MVKSFNRTKSLTSAEVSKGEDLKTSPLQLAIQRGQNSLRLAKNCVYTASGAVTKRFDRTILTTSSVGASVKITGGIRFTRSNGTSYDIFGTDDGRIILLNSDGTTTNQVTGLTTGTKWYFVVYNDLLIACNRADAPRKFDGTTWGTLGGSPPSTGGPVAIHGNRVFFADATQLSRLTWSALNNEEDYTTANDAGSVQISENDGSNLIDMVPGINELILLKGSRPYRLQGTSPSTFAITNVVPTTGSKGAISTKGNIFAVNDVWFLADNGVLNLRTVLNFGDLKASYGSDRISPRFEPLSDDVVTLQNLDDAVAVYDAQNNRIYWCVDSNGDDANDLILCLDLHTNGWSHWLVQPMASLWLVKNATNGIVEVYGGGYDGHIRVLNRDVSTNTIDGEARHLSALGQPGIQKSPRHAWFYFKEEGNYTVTIDTKFDFGATGGQTYTASLLAGTHTLGVDWVLGVDPLGAREQITRRIDLSGVGEFLEVGVRNQNAGEPFTWYGYEVLWRPRRAVRPSTTAN